MDGHPHKKRRVGSKLNSGFIGSLPKEIIEMILVKLPIKEAIRTCILSKNWKNSWVSMPDLVFMEDFTDHGIAKLVDMVLLAHQGPIRKFELVSVHSDNEETFRWISILSQNRIKDLRLNFYRFGNIPSNLFSCRELENLEMSNCCIYATPDSQGLKLLRNLKLSQCTLTGITIEKLVSSCPLLESLTLSRTLSWWCDRQNCDSLIIRAPNLKRLELHDNFIDISLETPKLIFSSISLDTGSYSYPNFSPACKSKIPHVLGQLPDIEELEICHEFCEYLATGPIPKKLPVTFDRLKKIVIHLNHRSRQEAEAALCIFQNSPNLKTLHVELSDFSVEVDPVPVENIWEIQGRTTEAFLFKHLEIVKVLRFRNKESVLWFAKFILSTAPVLEKLAIDKDYNDLRDGLKFATKLESFPRLSSKAVILFEEFEVVEESSDCESF